MLLRSSIWEAAVLVQGASKAGGFSKSSMTQFWAEHQLSPAWKYVVGGLAQPVSWRSLEETGKSSQQWQEKANLNYRAEWWREGSQGKGWLIVGCPLSLEAVLVC